MRHEWATRPSSFIPQAWIDIGLLAPILGLGLAMRSVNLGAYSGLFDEGIRTEQLFLMSAGYRPFRDIFAAQGPLLLDLLHPWYVLFGQDLVAARLSVALYSLVGLAGTYWVGRLAGGRLGGAAAALFLALSPLYLEGSRLALAEVPALAPAILAIGAGLMYMRRCAVAGQPQRRGWLLAAGILLAVSVSMKPITLAACVPIGLAILSRGRAARRDLLVVGGVVAIFVLVAVFAVGLAAVLEQIVDYRLESRASEGWSLAKNRLALARALSFEQTALLGLALGGGLLLVARRGWDGVCLVAWACASVVLLLAYSPLHGKHVVIMIAPVAAMAGAGVGLAWLEFRAPSRLVWRAGVSASFLGLLAWYAATAPPSLAQSGQLMRVTADSDVDPAFEQYADAVAVIGVLSRPTDFVVTDHPYLTFLARRLVPPALVDTSRARIRSRSLRASEAVAIATTYAPSLVVLWTDRLRGLRDFKAWVEENYRLVKVYNRRQDLDRGIYVGRSADLASVRSLLDGGTMMPTNADFGGELRLVGSAIDRLQVRRGDGTGLALHWESLRPLAADYHVLAVLRGPDGQAWDQQEESLAGGSVGTNEWEPGHWLFQNTFVRADSRAPTGQLSVGVSVYDSRARRIVRLADGREELIVGYIQVQ